MTILIITLTITSMLLLIFYQPIFETSKNVVKSSLISDKITKDMNGKERLYSLLNKNISFEGTTLYPDLEKEYKVTTIDEDFEVKELHFNSHELNNFFLNNETNIEIEVTVSPLDPLEPFSYGIELMLEEEDLLEETGLDLQADVDINIPANKIYNRETGETKYGEYVLNIPHADNCIVKAVVVYNKLYHREINVESEGFNENITINNDDKITIKMERGD